MPMICLSKRVDQSLSHGHNLDERCRDDFVILLAILLYGVVEALRKAHADIVALHKHCSAEAVCTALTYSCAPKEGSTAPEARAYKADAPPEQKSGSLPLLQKCE